MTAPTLLFCLGATKAGTSWLHAQLRRHPDCAFSSLKELHYFDSLEPNRLPQQKAAMELAIERLALRMVGADLPKRRDLAQRVEDRAAWRDVLAVGRADHPAYLAYLQRDAAGARVVGDITPAYGLLPQARLAEMAALSQEVHFAYLLRDPVARLWSHVRMNTQRQQNGAAFDPSKAHTFLDAVLQGGHDDIARRGDYRTILEKLDRVAAPSRRTVLFFEEMVQPGGLTPLCTALSIRAPRDAPGGPVHTGPKAALDPDAARAARAWLEPQYSYVHQRFGRLPQSWQESSA